MTDAVIHSELFLKVAIPVPLDRLFDYRLPADIAADNLQPGIRVKVPFGNTHKIGILLEISPSSDIEPDRLKAVSAVLDDKPLLSELDINLLIWASRYYHHPVGEVFHSAIPVALRKGKAAVIHQEDYFCLTDKGRQISPAQLKRAKKQQALIEFFQSNGGSLSATLLKQWNPGWRTTVNALLKKQLLAKSAQADVVVENVLRQSTLKANPEQQQAIEQISQNLNAFSVFLLEGVTGSGKTEVYMQVIEKILHLGKQVLVLLPEITLTPQLEQRFRQRFNVPVVSSHSRMTDNERLNAWLKMQTGSASILLGTRSALFTSLKNPGIIIMDEEHDSSFKQQEGFRFSARDVAIVKARNLNIPVVLGSATPALESLYNVKQKRYQHLLLPSRAGKAIKPDFCLLDVRNKKMHSGLSDMLVSEISKVLEKNEQVLLFLNRRGFAPVQMCHSCGYVSRCPRCDANMVIHFADNRLRCHHCGTEHRLQNQCPACHADKLQPVGLGTERIEQTLADLFKQHSIIRLDRDSTQRKGRLEDYLEQINRGDADIILGTQMLAKGHHFPNVTLVALLDVDSGLFSTDFHSSEKLAQMIVQVAGRAGRGDKPGRVILQTHHPDHPLLLTLINQGYQTFAQSVLQERQQAGLPPYSFQALLRVQAANSEAPQIFLQELTEKLSPRNNGCLILGPVPAPMLKRAGQHRYQLLIQNQQRKSLHKLLDIMLAEIKTLKSAKKVRWSLDVDPVSLY